MCVCVCVCVCVLCVVFSLVIDFLLATRMFCEHQAFANFARVDQCNNKIAKLLLVNTHDPCQNVIVRSQKVN